MERICAAAVYNYHASVEINMLQRLILHNFQNHEHSEFVFVPGINAIVGGTNVGKSVAIRGLEWVRTNRPLGTSFIRHGADRKDVCEVEIVCVKGKNSHNLKRTRSVKGSVNEYRLGNNAMKAIGSDVPQEIADCLNMEDLNIQRQLSPHFLVLASPGAVGKAVNAAVHLEQMDACVSEANKRMRSLQGQVDNDSANIGRFETELSEFENLDAVEDDLIEAVAAYKEVNELTKRMQDLSQAMWDLEKVETKITMVPDAELVRATQAQIELMEGIESDCARLRKWVNGYVDVATELRSERKLSQLCQGQLLEAMKGEACTLCGRELDDDAKLYVLGEV